MTRLRQGSGGQARDLFGQPVDETTERADGEGYMLAHHAERDTDLAICVSESGDAHRLKFLPRSRITFRDTGKFVQVRIGAEKLAVIEVSIPEWLAKDKGLI